MFSIPQALCAIPILSGTERMIITKIINKKTCTFSNENLAERHRCSKPVVSNAISKAKRLGMQKYRTDEKYTYKTESGNTAQVQNRKIELIIPEVWEFFGEVWSQFYFNGCPRSKIILTWLNNYITIAYQNKNKQNPLNLNQFLLQYESINLT